MNNIFDFATSELSQDAFLCWCLNWINEEPSETTNKYRQLGLDLLRQLLDTKRNTSENGKLSNIDFESIDKILIAQQVLKIDILVIIPKYKVAIIIEDKINASEYKNQINSYKSALANVLENKHSTKSKNKILAKLFRLCKKQKCFLDYKELASYHIHTVYVKTGYYFGPDWDVVNRSINNQKGIDEAAYVDNYLTAPMLWDILETYKQSESDILQSYCSFLSEKLNWYQETAKFWKKYENSNTYYISWERLSQHGFLQVLFDEEDSNCSIEHPSWLWKDLNLYGYEYRTGSNPNGRPWTHRKLWSKEKRRELNDESFNNLYWRVDTDKQGPYLAFRYYYKTDSDTEKVVRKQIYERFNAIIDEKVAKKLEQLSKGLGPVSSEDSISRPNHGNCHENTLIHISLKNVLDDWDNKKDDFIKNISDINKELKSAFESEIKNIKYYS